MAEIKIRKFENPNWDSLNMKNQGGNELEIVSHSEWDVSIELDINGNLGCFILNQSDLKQLIEFLQSRVK